MTSPPHSGNPPARRTPRWAWVVLGLILLFDVWWRGHTIGPTVLEATGLRLWPVVTGQAEPLDCDEAIYGYIGRRLAEGAVMYRDLTENKPPLGYWLYALAVGIGGATETTIRLMPVPMVLGTIALVWWIGLRLRGPATASITAITYVLLSTDPYLFANGANMEPMINLFTTASLALMVRYLIGGRPRSLIGAGACVAAAVLVKPVAGLHGILYALAVAIHRREPHRWRARIRGSGYLAAGFAVPCLLAIIVLAGQGAFRQAYADAVLYGGALVTDVEPEPNQPPSWMRWLVGNADPNGALPRPFGRTTYLVWWGAGSWPFWLASVPGLAWLILRRSKPDDPPGGVAGRRLVGIWTLSAWVQVMLPGLYWPHYYQLPTPGVALAVAVLANDALASAFGVGVPTRTSRRLLAGMVGLATLGAIAATGWIQVRDYLLVAPEQLTIRYKGGGQWVVLREVGREFKRRSVVWDDPRLFVWGIQSPLYFYGGLDGVTPQVFADNLVRDHAATGHPLIRPRIERTIRDLRAERPELIFAGYPPFPELRAFLNESYIPSALEAAGQPLAFPNGMGLWIEPKRYAAFERFPPRGQTQHGARR